jgi:hypothetical protein
MTVALSAEIDGKYVPLTECDWVLWRRCGCPQGVCTAATRSMVLAPTEDAAWREFYDTNRDVAKAQRDGMRLELMTHARYSAEACPRMNADCPHS